MGDLKRLLISGQPGGAGWNPAHNGDWIKGAIVPDSKAVNRSIAVGQIVKESAIAALGHVNGVAASTGHSRSAIRIK